MKRLWIVFALLFVIAVIAGVLMYLNKEEPFKEDRTLYSYPDRTVEEIRIVSEQGEIHFVKKQNEWAMISPKPYKIDASMLFSLENRLKNFLVSRILNEDTEDLQRYGLNTPSASIYFRLDDGTENTLLIGEMTASKVQYYAKDSARELIYILGSYDVENFLRPINEFRDKTLLSIDPESISVFGLDKADAREYKLVSDDSGKWRIVEPLEIDARGDAVTEIMDNIKKLKIKDFITDEADDLSRYGLDMPGYTLNLADAVNKKQSIHFGRFDEDNQIVYINTDNKKEVYTLSLEVFDPRRFKIAEFLNEAPLSVGIAQVSKVVIIERDNAVEFAKDMTQEGDVFTFGGKEIKQEDFTTLYVNIMALTAEGYDPENQGGAPALTVILELADSRVIKAEFAERDDLTYFMSVDGEPRPFFIGARKIDLIRRWRDRVLDGI